MADLRVVAIFSMFVAFIFVVQRRWSARGKFPLPPQPLGWMILSNSLEFIPNAKAVRMHTLLERWARDCGEIIRVQVGPTANYYINSNQAVKAIFNEASAQTSERPRWTVSNEQLCNKWDVLLLNSSEAQWKLQESSSTLK